MTIKRRDFIGSLLGTLCASQLPFHAIAANLRGSISELPERVRIALWTPAGDVIWAPDIATRIVHSLGVRFLADRMKPTADYDIEGMILADERGRILREQKYERPTYVRSAWNQTIELSWHFNVDLARWKREVDAGNNVSVVNVDQSLAAWFVQFQGWYLEHQAKLIGEKRPIIEIPSRPVSW